MGGIYSKEDTSFLIICSSFLFPINIWVIFIGSQFSSVIPHMVLQHRLSQARALTVCTQSAEKPFLWKAVRSDPQYFIKLNKESLTHEETTEKRNITLNKVVQQVWKKTSKNYPVCIRYSKTQCQSIMYCIKPTCISSSHQREAAVAVSRPAGFKLPFSL